MKKRIISLLLAVIMVFSLMPVTVFAGTDGEHTHTVGESEETFDECNNLWECQGGGVYVDGGSFVMNGGSIVGNVNVGGDGGGMAFSGNGCGSFTMTGGSIADNTASCVISDPDGDPMLIGGKGGGVYAVIDGHFTVTGGEITGNAADGAGSGVFLSGDNATLGVTLDLDGHALTVPGVTVLGTGLVTDGSTGGTGRLITDKGKFNYSPSGDTPRSVAVSTVSNQRVLPVWKDGGYSFCGMEKIGTAWATDEESRPKFKFTLYSGEINAILEGTSGVDVGIHLDYTRDGNHAKDYLVDAKTVSDYVKAGASKNHIYAAFTGTTGITAMSAYTYLTSCGLRLYNASASYDIGPN